MSELFSSKYLIACAMYLDFWSNRILELFSEYILNSKTVLLFITMIF